VPSFVLIVLILLFPWLSLGDVDFTDVFSTASAFAVRPVSPASATPPIRTDRRVVKG
jgi:hypothetical protein